MTDALWPLAFALAVVAAWDGWRRALDARKSEAEAEMGAELEDRISEAEKRVCEHATAVAALEQGVRDLQAQRMLGR